MQSAIHLHPLRCAGFNADFVGDQMLRFNVFFCLDGFGNLCLVDVVRHLFLL
jgi:hypothetical protein